MNHIYFVLESHVGNHYIVHAVIPATKVVHPKVLVEVLAENVGPQELHHLPRRHVVPDIYYLLVISVQLLRTQLEYGHNRFLDWVCQCPLDEAMMTNEVPSQLCLADSFASRDANEHI